MLHIKLKGKKCSQDASKMFDLTHCFDLPGLVERSVIEIVHISIFLAHLSQMLKEVSYCGWSLSVKSQ